MKDRIVWLKIKYTSGFFYINLYIEIIRIYRPYEKHDTL